MNTYEFLVEHGFNGITAMDLGLYIGLSWMEDSEEIAMKKHNDAVVAIEQYCKDYNIADELQEEFRIEVNEYSLK